MSTIEEQRAAFREGFASRLAEAGLTPGDFCKKAGGMADTVGKTFDLAAKGFGKVYDTSKLLAFGVPITAAGMMGHAMARPQRVGDADIKALKQRALIEQYRRATAELREQQQRQAEEAR